MGKPEIRFKGYTDEWEQRKVVEVAPLQRGFDLPSASMKPGKYPVVMSNGIGGYHFEYKVKGPGVVTGRSGTIGKLHYIEDDYWPHNTTLWVTDFNGNNQKFIYYLYQGLDLNRFGTGSGVPTLNRNDVHDAIVSVPSKNEQERISAYLTILDQLITLHQRKCDEVKSLKKYMLQKMFPQNEQKVPEIRFEGFTEAWEQRKFGEITELKSASRVHKDEWTSNGVPFYRSSDVMAAINGTENEKAFISEKLYEKLSKVSGKLEEGDILVTGGGSVGNPYIVPNNKPLYTKDADLLWIKNKGKFHPYFLYEFFFSPTFRNYLGSISHVGTIAHYTITQLSDTPICLPSFEEQKEVGEYFQSLDHLITLHQQKCEKLKKIKKFMLQKMFV